MEKEVKHKLILQIGWRMLLIPLWLAGAGCASLVAHVEPSFRKVSYADLRPPASRPSVGVLVEFQRRGKSFSDATGQTRATAIEVLQKSQLFSFVSSGTVGTTARMELKINNAQGETHGSPVATGLTAGLAGTTTVDPYIFSASYTADGRMAVKREYNHKLYARLGAGGLGDGVKTTTVQEAYREIVEDFVLRFLVDIQTEGAL